MESSATVKTIACVQHILNDFPALERFFPHYSWSIHEARNRIQCRIHVSMFCFVLNSVLVLCYSSRQEDLAEAMCHRWELPQLQRRLVVVGFVVVVWAQVAVSLRAGCWKQRGSVFVEGKHETTLWITSSTVQTYCQSNWCPPQSPAVGWIRPSASEDRSSPDPGRRGAFLPQWFQLQTRREMVSNRFDWAVVFSVDYDSSTDATCEVTQLLMHFFLWQKCLSCETLCL